MASYEYCAHCNGAITSPTPWEVSEFNGKKCCTPQCRDQYDSRIAYGQLHKELILGLEDRSVSVSVDPRWKPLAVPDPKGVFRTLEATFRAYDVSEDTVLLVETTHGVDINPGAPRAPGEGPLRGPFGTLFIVTLNVHCTQTGERKEFPFKFGHSEVLRDKAYFDWLETCLIRLFTHEVEEALR